MSGRPWTAEEDAVIRLHAGNLQDKQIAVLLGRTTDATRWRRNQLISKGDYPPDWSEAEVVLLRERYATTSVPELLKLLPWRTYAALQSKARWEKLRQRKPRESTGLAWSQDEDEKMLALYPDNEVASLAGSFPGRSAKAIERRASTLGLKHSAKFWKTHYATKIGLACYPPELQEVIRLGRKLKKAINDHESQHP